MQVKSMQINSASCKQPILTSCASIFYRYIPFLFFSGEDIPGNSFVLCGSLTPTGSEGDNAQIFPKMMC